MSLWSAFEGSRPLNALIRGFLNQFYQIGGGEDVTKPAEIETEAKQDYFDEEDINSHENAFGGLSGPRLDHISTRTCGVNDTWGFRRRGHKD